MHKALLGAAVAAAFLGMGSAAQSAPQQLYRLAVANPVRSAVCVGNRRNFRSFSQCWRLNAKNSKLAANYCSRICSNTNSK
jgi:hypothetical protein